jgi:hypothetical protein
MVQPPGAPYLARQLHQGDAALAVSFPPFSGMPMWFSEQSASDEHVYRRPLPSGGYVAISAQPVQPLFAASKIRGHIVVERRGPERRAGHPAPIVAVAEKDTMEALLAALVPVAESDELLQETLARRVTIPITKRGLPPA